MMIPKTFARQALPIAIALTLPMTAVADADYDALKRQVEQLQQQLLQVQEALKQQDLKFTHIEETTITRDEAIALEQKVNAASEWRDPNTLIHMSGYADVGYVDGDNQDGSFVAGSFSPIFHFQYKDLVMMEAELEYEIEEDGETETNLEYMTIDWFVNDYATLVGGKFLSPIGQFRQNLHPSWINKLPSAPPGFGHDGAAPTSELGVQLRGGFPLGKMRSNYAIYLGNGPELIAEFEDGEFELDGIDAEAKGFDNDGEQVWGGRFAILPFAGLEIGVSAATGKATVTSIEVGGHDGEEEDEHDADEEAGAPELHDEEARDYDVFGVDGVFHYKAFTLRGEYVKSKVGKATTGATASASGDWESWYTQASFLIPNSKFEGVVRYTDFDTPHDSADQEQWSVGVNYLFSSNFIGKIAYELNDGEKDSTTDDDRWMIQLAYGF